MAGNTNCSWDLRGSSWGGQSFGPGAVVTHWENGVLGVIKSYWEAPARRFCQGSLVVLWVTEECESLCPLAEQMDHFKVFPLADELF